MRQSYTSPAGVLFLAVLSVYSGPAGEATCRAADTARGVGTEVKLLDDGPRGDEDGTAPASRPAHQATSLTTSQVNVNESGTVEIHVNDASLVEVLRMLSLQSQKNIVASKDVQGTVTANLYDVTVREALDAILHANGFAYREKGNFIYIYTAKELAERERAERKVATEVFRLYYTPAAYASTMIKPVLSGEANVSFTAAGLSGIESGTKDLGGASHATEDTLVVTDYADNLVRVRELLKEIDRRPQQILIEATILRAALTEDNALGVDFTVLGGVDFSTVANENGQITGAQLPSGVTGADRAVSIGTGNNFTQGLGGMRLGVVTNNIAIFLSALEQVTDTVVLANPKVLALNKQKGEVIVGRKDGYLTTTVTESATVQTVEFLDTGTRLIFRPYIGSDGYIRMEIHPEDSSGGLTDNNLPFKITTEVTSNVMVKDGHTVVIGGLFREDSSSARSQVPFLGNIPLAGNLFRRQRDRTTREEVIILLTPHIIKDDVAYAQASEAELKAAEKLRVGVRQGMLPWGRERMAESSYETALAEMSKANPNRQRALWHLNCATNLNPKFIEAIDLKQSITGVEVTSADNSTIRSFVRRQILADRAVEAPAAPAVPIEPATRPTTAPVVLKNADTSSTGTAEGGCATSEPCVAQPPPAVQPSTRPAVAHRYSLWSMMARFNRRPESQPTVVVELPAEP